MCAKVTKMQCGGWLAVSAQDEPIKIGITADTKEQAYADHARALGEWRALLAAPSGSEIDYQI